MLHGALTAGMRCGCTARSLLGGTVSSCCLLVECGMEMVSVKSQYLPLCYSFRWDMVHFSPLNVQRGDKPHPLLLECFPHPRACPQPSSPLAHRERSGKTKKEALQSGAAIQQLTRGHYCSSSPGSSEKLSQFKVK